MSPRRLLAFAEDPGAAVYLGPLPAAAAQRGWIATLVASAPADATLRGLDVAFENDLPTTLDGIDVVVVGTSENRHSPAFDLIARARASGRATVGVVDSPISLDRRFRGTADEPLAYAPDWLVVPSESVASAYRDLGHPAARIVVCGHPLHDVVRRERARMERTDRVALRRALFARWREGMPVITFLAEISDGLDSDNFRRSSAYELAGRGSSTGRTEIVLEEVLDALAAIAPRPYVVLRLSPKNNEAEFAAYRDEIDVISQGGSPWPVLCGSDVVVGMTTMALQESILLGRPTISVVPRHAELNWLPDGVLDLIPCVTRRDQVRSTLKEAIAHPRRPDPRSVDAVFPVHAVERFVAVLDHAYHTGRSSNDESPRSS